ESTLHDSKAEASVDLAQVPRHLADRAALRVGTEVVLVGGERFHEPDGALGLTVPGGAERVDFMDRGHREPPGEDEGSPGESRNQLTPGRARWPPPSDDPPPETRVTARRTSP